MKTLIFTSISLLLIFPQSLQAQSKISWGGSIGGFTNSFVNSYQSMSSSGTYDSTVVRWNVGRSLAVSGYMEYHFSEKNAVRAGVSLYHVTDKIDPSVIDLPFVWVIWRRDQYRVGVPVSVAFQLPRRFSASIGIMPNVYIGSSLTTMTSLGNGEIGKSTEWDSELGIFQQWNLAGQAGLSYGLYETDKFGIRLFTIVTFDGWSQIDWDLVALDSRVLRIGGGIELVSIR